MCHTYAFRCHKIYFISSLDPVLVELFLFCFRLHYYEEVLHNFGTYIRQKWKGKILLPNKSTFIDSVSFSFYNQVRMRKTNGYYVRTVFFIVLCVTK